MFHYWEPLFDVEFFVKFILKSVCIYHFPIDLKQQTDTFAWIQINRKMVNTILFRVDMVRFGKYFSVRRGFRDVFPALPLCDREGFFVDFFFGLREFFVFRWDKVVDFFQFWSLDSSSFELIGFFSRYLIVKFFLNWKDQGIDFF